MIIVHNRFDPNPELAPLVGWPRWLRARIVDVFYFLLHPINTRPKLDVPPHLWKILEN